MKPALRQKCSSVISELQKRLEWMPFQILAGNSCGRFLKISRPSSCCVKTSVSRRSRSPDARSEIATVSHRLHAVGEIWRLAESH